MTPVKCVDWAQEGNMEFRFEGKTALVTGAGKGRYLTLFILDTCKQ